MKKERQMNIISTIDMLGFASRTHIQEIYNLGSVRNTNRVLRDMNRYLNIFRMDENIYYLNQLGRDMIGSTKELKQNQEVKHYLMRNDMYVYLDFPEDWRLEHPVNFSTDEHLGGGAIAKKDYTIIPDAKCTVDNIRYYIEIDNLQHMKENKKKIDIYSKLRQTYHIKNQRMYKLIFYTSSDVRRKRLTEWCLEKELQFEVLTKKDIL
jgi:hypothetical protein